MASNCDELGRKAREADEQLNRLLAAENDLRQQQDNAISSEEKKRLKDKYSTISEKVREATRKEAAARRKYTDCLSKS